jgi:hypothetical protein
VTKLRISNQLHAKARECAKACNRRLSEWIGCATRQHKRGVYDGVAFDADLLSATREDSTTITIEPTDMEAKELRRVIAMGCVHAEARRVFLRTDISTEWE